MRYARLWKLRTGGVVAVTGAERAQAGRVVGPLLAALVCLGAVPGAGATTIDDLCDSPLGPCVVSGSHQVDDGSVLDAGDRELRVVGEISVGGGVVTLRARQMVLEGALSARGSRSQSGGTIRVEAGAILINGPIDTSGARGGTIELIATGETAVQASINADALHAAGNGGTIVVAAEMVRINAVVTAVGGMDNGGGSIEVHASGDLVLAGILNVSGGDGGSIGLFGGGGHRGSVTIAVGARILNDATFEGCSGGTIRIFAGSTQNRNALIAVDGQLRATGRDGNRDDGGGSGGAIHMESTGDLRAGPFSSLAATGGGPDGIGGDALMSSGGFVSLGGTIDVGASGRESFGGTVRVQAAGDLEVSGAIAARAALAGDIELTSGGASVLIAVAADLDTRTSGSAAGGDVTISSAGTLRVDGTVQSDGGSGPQGEGGRNAISACVLEIGASGLLRSKGLGGSNFLAGRNDLIVAGTLLADADAGHNEIRFLSLVRRPVYLVGAVVVPAAEEVVDASLLPCRATRTPTPSATPTRPTRLTPTPSATPTLSTRLTPTAPVCPGDCTGDGVVTVDEIVLGTNVGLGLTPVARCPAMDTNGDARVTVNEIVAAVAAGLIGCPGG